MKKHKLMPLHWASVFGFFCMSLFFVLIYSAEPDFGPTPRSILAGALFWGGLACGVITQIMLLRRLRGELKKNRRVGLIRFLTNRWGAVADFAAVISLIGLVISFFFGNQSGLPICIFLSVFIFSFSMHCVFNGRKYNYLYRSKSKRSVRHESSI